MTQPSDETLQPTDAGDRCPKCGDDSCLIEGSDRCRIRELTSELSRLRERNAVLERVAVAALVFKAACPEWSHTIEWHYLSKALAALDHPAPQKTENDDEIDG